MSDPHALVENDICYLYTGHDVGFGIPDWVMPDWRIYRDRSKDRIRDCFIAPVKYDEKGLMYDDLSNIDIRYR